MTELQQRDIYSVTRLNREVRAVLDTGFPLIWLDGELSNLACPASGHWYFSLKDSQAQVRCAMFRTRNRLLRFVPKNGMQVLVRAKIGLYEPRGEFQIIVEHMEEAGEGALRQQFEQLKNKLNAQGIFSADNKKNLPAVPKTIGVITSPTGAAIHDVLTTLKRRFSALKVIVYPVSVQGKPAAEDISKTIKLVDKRNECDVLLLTRGGGSLEDLWSFNEEVVANAIYECKIPLISAVGHDIDFTISDFVADVRAATPTAAAELVSPDVSHWNTQLANLIKRLSNHTKNIISEKKYSLESISSRIIHPSNYIEQTSQRVDEYNYRLQYAIQSFIANQTVTLQALENNCYAHNPLLRISKKQDQTKQLIQRLCLIQQRKLNSSKQRFIASTATLDAVSPLATLQRGYAYVKNMKTDKVINNIDKIKRGDEISTTLANGRFNSTVTKIIKPK